ncbi:MAG: endopeptidase La [Desulfobacteraceae bacterium]|nr:endopeptidase La [Desulfobacteraceae bacterium]
MDETSRGDKPAPENIAEQQLPGELPFFIIPDMVLFPRLAIPLELEPEAAGFVNHVWEKDRLFAVFTRDRKNRDNIYDTGTAAYIRRRARTKEGRLRLLLQSICRVGIKELLPPDPYPRARIEPLVEIVDPDDIQVKALTRSVQTAFSRFRRLSPHLPKEIDADALQTGNPVWLADLVSSYLDVGVEAKQELLEELDVHKRLQKILILLTQEIEILEISLSIHDRIRDSMDRDKREHYLREQIKAIREELGEEESGLSDLRKRIEAKAMPAEAREEAERQFGRLSKISSSSPEFMVTHTYLEWLLDLPWQEATADNLDLRRAERVLDEHHFGLEQVKKRILEFLAVRKLKPEGKGPILCFLGPPGTGKTSLGRSIATALDRRFYRFSLGGMKDEAEIRGHRRTYVGAMPGRIIQAIKKAGVNNPVLMLDEVDKMGQDFRGDPASALLEVLDPEQNSAFVDHYLNVKFDLSSIFFIVTANQRDTIPAPLFDRMEMIELPGYTREEKLSIARTHLIPKQLAENGLSPDQLSFSKGAIDRMVVNYTREAGLRNLERRIAAVCRQVAFEVARGRTEKTTIRAGDVVDYLGPQKIFPEVAQRTSVPGVATGLAWTPVGGDILFIEATKMPGSQKLILTGKLGEVMQESARAALSILRSRAADFGVGKEFFESHDFHLHVPAGAIPKDGPSAGVTILIALASSILEKPVRSDVAMTGEITLRGMVLPVGGIKEKVLAARQAGIRKILLPRQNNYDLARIPERIREELEFHLISHVDEAIELAIEK